MNGQCRNWCIFSFSGLRCNFGAAILTQAQTLPASVVSANFDNRIVNPYFTARRKVWVETPGTAKTLCTCRTNPNCPYRDLLVRLMILAAQIIDNYLVSPLQERSGYGSGPGSGPQYMDSLTQGCRECPYQPLRFFPDLQKRFCLFLYKDGTNNVEAFR